MKVYIVYQFFPNEGNGDPIAVYRNKHKAELRAEKEYLKAKASGGWVEREHIIVNEQEIVE